MSCSESPNITKFFKPQRKRPRECFGKDDGIESKSKKLKELRQDGDGVIFSDEKGRYDDDSHEKSKLVNQTIAVAGSPVDPQLYSSHDNLKVSTQNKGAERSDQPKLSACFKSKSSQKDKECKNDIEKSEITSQLEPPVDLEKVVKEEKSEEISTKASFESSHSLGKESIVPTKKKAPVNSEQIAKLFKKKSRLSEVKSAIAGINHCSWKLKEFRRTLENTSPHEQLNEKPSVSNKGAIEVPPAQFYSSAGTGSGSFKIDTESSNDSVTTTRNQDIRKFVNLNDKTENRVFPHYDCEKRSQVEGNIKKIPAYQRFHTLAQKTPAEKGPGEDTQLPLPYNFKILKELFVAVDTVLGIMKGRKETILFPKVKAGVLQLFKTVSLREMHLAQMVTVLPNCYKFVVEKVGKEYQYKILVEDLLPSVVCARRKAFEANLRKICLDEHQKFLLGLVPPVVVPEDKKITRWHPCFKIDEIEITPPENALPTKPAPDKISTAHEVMIKAQNLLESNPRLKEAIKSRANMEHIGPSCSGDMSVSAPPKSTATLKALKGVSISLLEKIRTREREKMLLEMTRSPSESKNLQMAKRLPKYIKVIRNLMVLEKKVALPMPNLVERVAHSIDEQTEAEIEAHIRMLTTLLPKWAKIVKLSSSKVEYLRIDMKLDINNLLVEMEEITGKLS